MCPLCHNLKPIFFYENPPRKYYQCDRCSLIFVPKEFHLSQEAEKRIYLHHNNCSTDLGYRNFLNRVAIPLLSKLTPGDRGLDYGCGPGPTLSVLFEEKGFVMDNFDPIFFPDRSFKNKKYNFITATETIEHFCDPYSDLKTLWDLLSPGGWLALMTEFYDEKVHFKDWYYIKDPTHISLFSRKTIEYLSKTLVSDPLWVDNRVVFLRK